MVPTDRDIDFLAVDPKDFTYDTLTFDIYFPVKHHIYPVKISTLLQKFTKEQQMCILSHVTSCLVKRGITTIKFPKSIEKGCTLIGSDPSRLTLADMAKMEAENKTEGPIMPDHNLHLTPLAQIDALENLERMSTESRLQNFVHTYSSAGNRGYDCLPNALNYALRCPYFTQREQVVKLMAIERRHTYEEAVQLKSSGGLRVALMKNFAFANGNAFSIGKKPLAVIEVMGKFRKTAGQEVLDKVRELMMPNKKDADKMP